MRTLLRGMTCVVLLAGSGCNQHERLIDSPVGPTPSSALPPGGASMQPLPIPSTATDVATVNLQNGAVTAGASLRGVINLYGRAPAGGAAVSLTTNNNAASVPATVTVPAGEISAEFTVTTMQVSEDRQVVITARTDRRSAIAALAIWSRLPVFFSWFSEPDEFIGEGGYNRHTPGYSEFSVQCDGNELRVTSVAPEPDSWTLRFKAPEGMPLRAGSYESASQIGVRGPNATMLISGRERSCAEVSGRFVIHEIDLQDDRVGRFYASYEQRCLNTGLSGWLRGEVRVADLPVTSSIAGCQR